MVLRGKLRRLRVALIFLRIERLPLLRAEPYQIAIASYGLPSPSASIKMKLHFL